MRVITISVAIKNFKELAYIHPINEEYSFVDSSLQRNVPISGYYFFL